MEWFRPPGAGPVVSESNREIFFMILQFLREEKFKESSLHKLKQESGLFFDMKYFEDQVEAGEWEEVERYLSGFLKVNDESRTIFFEIGKQKYLEALDSNHRKQRKAEADRHLKILRFYLQRLQVLLRHLAYISRRLETDKTCKFSHALFTFLAFNSGVISFPTCIDFRTFRFYRVRYDFTELDYNKEEGSTVNLKTL